MENIFLNVTDELKLKQYMPTNKDVDALSNFFYAFSDSTRLKIVVLLTMRPMCVGGITQVLGFNQTTISHQLKILKSLNVVDCDRSGKNVVYYIKKAQVENVLEAVVDCI